MQSEIDVLALGDSKLLFTPKGNVTIGVNDIYAFYPTDYLVLCDPPTRFPEPDRYKTIMESRPKEFLCAWEWPVPNFKKIEFARVRGALDELDTHRYCYSNNSAFVACIHAYKLGAKVINLYGADFRTHGTLSSDNSIKTILKHFSLLREALTQRGVELRVTGPSVLAEILPPISG